MREQITVASTVAISLSLALGAFLLIKWEEASGLSIVNVQVANGLAKRSEGELLHHRQVLHSDPNAVQAIDSALALKSKGNSRN